MTVVIDNAWWLGGAACLTALVGMFWILARFRSRRWQITCVALPGAAAVLAALAMAGLGVQWNPLAQKVVMLLDVSPSTRVSPWRGPGGATWVRDLAELRLGPAREVTVVGFGGADGPRVLLDHVKIGDAARWPTEWAAAAEGVGSDLSGALAWRTPAEARANSALAPRWVITDGLVTGAATGQRPFDLGWTQVPPDPVDVAVVELGVHAARPAGGTPAQGLDIWARVRSTAKTDAWLTVWRDGELVSQQQVSFAEGGTRWMTIHDGKGAGSVGHHYQVKIERTPTPDPWPENDSGSILWMPATEAPRILIVGSAEGSEVLAGGPATHRGVVPAAQFPANVGQLLSQGWQVVVLNDVPLAPVEGTASATTGGVLSEPAVHVLEQFVRDTGGGLVIVGKKRAFGPGHYAEAADGRFEALSPVWSQPRDRPAAKVVFVLDASGSMNEAATGAAAGGERKFRLVARGVEQAMTLLKDQDRVTILTFSDHAEKIAAGAKEELVAGQNILRTRLDMVQPTGNTVPDTALPEVEAALQAKDPETAGGSVMVVLLTDGEIPAMAVAKWKAALAKNAAKLTIVAPPPSGEGSVLGSLAKEVGATWLATDDAGEWALLLKRAVAKELMGRAMTIPLPWKSVQSGLSGVTREWIEVWPKQPEAQLVATGEGSPARTLAVDAQRGLGRVAAVAMADDSPAYATLLQQVLKDVMPAPGDRRFTVWARRQDGRDAWVIGADGVEGGKFLDGQQLKTRVFSGASGEAQQLVDMPQTAPGRYEAHLDHTPAFAGMVVRADPHGEQLVGRVSPGRTEITEWPASVEHVEPPVDVQKVSTNDTDHRPWSPRIRGWQLSFTAAFWIAAAAAVLASLWARRGPVGAAR